MSLPSDQRLAALDREEEDKKSRMKNLSDAIERKETLKASAIKELEEKIAEIKKPYDAALESLREKHRVLHERVEYTISYEKNSIKENILISRAKTVGWDNDTAKALASRYGVDVYPSRIVNYSNGVTIVSINDAECSMTWLAVFKGHVIGIAVRRKAEHPADATTPYVWMGKSVLTLKNIMRFGQAKDYKGKYGYITHTRRNKGYREWSVVLKEKTSAQLAKIATIPPTKQNREVIYEAQRRY